MLVCGLPGGIAYNNEIGRVVDVPVDALENRQSPKHERLPDAPTTKCSLEQAG